MRQNKLERDYQADLIIRLKREFPGCVILKNDTSYQQGIPDLAIFWLDRWAMLEVKAAFDSPDQPNQPWWVAQLNEMSFAAFIFPENEEEVIHGLHQAFRTRRSTRLSGRK